MPWGEQASIREGIFSEFGRENWQPEAVEDYFEDPVPEYDYPAPTPAVEQVNGNNLEALSQMGFTVRVVE